MNDTSGISVSWSTSRTGKEDCDLARLSSIDYTLSTMGQRIHKYTSLSFSFSLFSPPSLSPSVWPCSHVVWWWSLSFVLMNEVLVLRGHVSKQYPLAVLSHSAVADPLVLSVLNYIDKELNCVLNEPPAN